MCGFRSFLVILHLLIKLYYLFLIGVVIFYFKGINGILCWHVDPSISITSHCNEKLYKPTDQYANVMFLLLYTFSITFLIV